MDLGLKSKRVLITGASQGIGKEIAKGFAEEGSNVSIVARRREKLKEVLNELERTKEHDYYEIDLMEKGAPLKTVKDLYKKNGTYDIVVHNLGGTLDVRDPLSSMEDYDRVWKFNVGISIEMNNFLIPKMQEKKWGRIINISSLSANHIRGCAAYGPAKAFLNAYTKVIGKNFAKEGIVACALLPCSIYSEGGHWDEEMYTKDEKELFLNKRADFMKHYCPRGKLGTAKEIADFAVFMGSEQASLGSSCLIPIGATEELGF